MFSLPAKAVMVLTIMSVAPVWGQKFLSPAGRAAEEVPRGRSSAPEERTCMIDNPGVTMSFYNSDFTFYDDYTYWQDYKVETPDGSRHRIMKEQGTDPTTSVSVLPEGGEISIRLGTQKYCEGELAKGGGVKFEYAVSENNAIVYAVFSALVEDPLYDHIQELEALKGQTVQYGDYSFVVGDYSTITNYSWTNQQPIITFYIEEDGIRKECSARSIFSYWDDGTSTQYGAVIDSDNYGHPAYFNDWTVMAVDLSPYIGRTISFGAEYHDCAEAGFLFPLIDGSVNYDYPITFTCDDRHISRLYLHPSYGPAQIEDVDEDCKTSTYTYSAPEGFAAYRWYAADQKSVTLSTGRTCSYTFSEEGEEVELCCELTSRLTIDCGTTVIRKTVTNNCEGCDNRMITQRWNDFLSVSKTAYDKYGGFADYQWYKDDIPLSGEMESQLYLPEEGLDGTSGYSVEMTCLKDGTRVRTCPYYPAVEPNTVTLSVVPTAVSASDNAPLRIRVSEPAEARLYNQTGLHVATWVVNAESNSYTMPSMRGLYLLKVRTESGKETTKKIAVK